MIRKIIIGLSSFICISAVIIFALPYFILQSFEIKGENKSFNAMISDFNRFKNYNNPFNDFKNGSNYYYHFEKGMDHFLIIRSNVNKLTKDSIKIGKDGWDTKRVGLLLLGRNWYYNMF